MTQHRAAGRWSPRKDIWLPCLALGLSLLILWLLYPLTAPLHVNAGHDFMILYGAALAMRHHQNPYDGTVLLPYVQMTGIPLRYLVDRTNQLNQPYVYPPLFAWLVVPLTYLSPPVALFVWRLISSIGIFAGTYGIAAPLRNETAIFGTRPRRLMLACLVLAAPMSVYGLYWGNPVALVYTAIGCEVWALTRGEKWSDLAAGALMTVTLLKPQLALPVAVLAAACFLQSHDMWRRWRHVGYGFLGTVLLLLTLDLLATGPQLLLAWPHSILFLSRLTQRQPDMPSLLGLLHEPLRRLSTQQYLQISAIIVALSIVAVVVVFWRAKRMLTPATLFGFLAVVWCFGVPYAHANDDILLVPGALVLLMALYGMAEKWAARSHPCHQPGHTRWRARDVASAVLSVLALGVFYLGGVLQYMQYHGHLLQPNIAIGLAPLMLLAALVVAFPLFAQQQEIADRLPRAGQAVHEIPMAGQGSMDHPAAR